MKFRFNFSLFLLCELSSAHTIWNEGTKLQNSKLLHTQLEKLIILFLDKKSPKDACDFLNYDFVDEHLNINTVRRYFTIFCEITLDFYQEEMDYMLLENEVEIDETHLFREKKSSAPHRGYKLSSIWLFRMKQ